MAADTYTALLGLLKQGTGNNNNTWGSLLNSGVFDETDLAIAGRLAISTTGGTTDLSGTPPPAGPSGAIYAILDISGTLSSSASIKVPNLTKIWLVNNACTLGGFTVTLKTPSGSASSALPVGFAWVWCNGSDVCSVGLSTALRDTQWLGADGTVVLPGISFASDPDSGLYRIGANDLGIAVNGVKAIDISPTAVGVAIGGVEVVDITSTGMNIASGVLSVGGVQVNLNWVAAGGTADAITATYSPAVPSLTDGLLCFFRATASNATTTPTFAPNGLTAHTITKKGGAVLSVGDIPGNLSEVILRYNLASTRWELLNPVAIPAPPPAGHFKNLSIKVATNTTVAVAADSVVTTDGTNFLTTALSGTVNLGTNGAANALDTGTVAIDSWYAIWAIAKPDGTTAALASLSATAPTLPTGYTYKARLGWVRTIHASATLYGTWQLGREAQFKVGLAQTTILKAIAAGPAGTYSTTAPVWSVADITPYAPSTASRIKILMTNDYNGATVANVIIAPTNSYGGLLVSPGTPPVASCNGTFASSIMVDMLLEATTVAWAADQNGGVLLAFGWTDNI